MSLAAALMAACGSWAATAHAGATGPVTVSVSSSTVGPPVAAGFVGLTTEYWYVEKEVGTDPSKPDVPFENALRNLAPEGGFSLRIGGNSADWTWWPVQGMKQPPWVKYALTPTWGAVTRRLASDLHAHLIVGINMEADSLKVASTEISQIAASVGRYVPTTFELGNEPELYSVYAYYVKDGREVKGRPKDYSYADITSQWNHMADALPRVRWAGPGYSSLNALPYVGQFLDASRRLSLLTVHTYPLKAQLCEPHANLQESQLFDPQSLQTMAGDLGALTKLARSHRVEVRVDEMNSVTCGGTPGFSNTFGPALWALNILPLYEQTGANGVNFENKPNSAQNLIQPNHTRSGWQIQVQPEYYGLAAVAQLTPPGSRILRVSATPGGLYAWAVRTPKRQEHVVVTNVGAHASTVAIQAAGVKGPATIEALKAKSGGLKATGGITLGGQRISERTGRFIGGLVTKTVRSSHGTYDVTVPPASAAIVTLKR